MHHEGQLVEIHLLLPFLVVSLRPFEKLKTDVCSLAGGAGAGVVATCTVSDRLSGTNPLVAPGGTGTLGLKPIGWNNRSLDT
jgi:hypothetical protein